MKEQLEETLDPMEEHKAVHNARNAEYIEQIETLQSAVDDYKETERRLQREVEVLEKRLFDTETDLRRLRDQQTSYSSKSRGIDSDHYEKLQERDSANAQLVNQSMTLESEVAQLKIENPALKGERGFGGGHNSIYSKIECEKK